MKILTDNKGALEKFHVKNGNEAKQLYSEICRGYSSVFMGENEENEFLYIKHLSELENTDFFEILQKYEEIAESRGLPTEKEKLEQLNEMGAWTNAEERDRKDLIESISFSKGQQPKLALKSQQEACRIDIENKEKLLKEKSEIRESVLDVTSESWASKKTLKYQIFFTFFKDENLQNPLFDESVYDEYGEEDLWEYVVLMNNHNKWFSDSNLKKIVAWPFFLNSYFLLDEDPTNYFGKPMVDLSINQTDLLSNGRWIKGILTQCGKNPPDNLYEDLDALLNWYNAEQGKIQSKRLKEERKAQREQNKNNKRSL